MAWALGSSPAQGLPTQDAAATERRQLRFGMNAVPKPPLHGFFELCVEAVGDPVLIILCVAGAVSFGVGLYESPSGGKCRSRRGATALGVDWSAPHRLD